MGYIHQPQLLQYTSAIQFPIHIMANSPDHHEFSPYSYPSSTSPMGQAGESPAQRYSHLQVPTPPSRAASPTQYEFIMTTGDESAASAKQKLRTVRSHVMKNYLHQQQHQQSQERRGEASLSRANSMRRKSKQRSRSSRSTSHESEQSPSLFEGGVPVSVEIENLFGGFSFAEHSVGHEANLNLALGKRQRFALDFNYNAPQDNTSVAARAYVSSLLQDKKKASPEPTFETLNAKGEVVRIVKETLGVCGSEGEVPQSIIFAVSLLAFGCAMDCEWDQARGHSEALKRIVDSRGGPETLDFELQRIFTWTVYCLAGALALPPLFPPPSFPNAVAFPLALLDDAQIRAWRTVKRFPKDSSFVFDVVSRLHHLSLATSSEWYEEVDQRTLSNVYFEAMYHSIQFEHEGGWQANIPAGVQGQEAVMMYRVWAAGLPLYIWATIRHVRRRLGLVVTSSDHEPVLARIKDAFDAAGGHHSWPRGKQLEPVLATLVYGIESCDYSRPWRMWAMDTLRTVVGLLKLKSEKEFRKTLDFFPSTEEYQATAGEVWAEIVNSGSGAGTPILSFSPLA